MPRATDPAAIDAPTPPVPVRDRSGETPPAPETAPEPAIELPADDDSTGDSTGTEQPEPEQAPPAPVTLDNDALNAADGDAAVWGTEFGRFLTALTGFSIEPGSLVNLFAAFGQQVQTRTVRQTAIIVANSEIRAVNQSREVLVAQMDLRGDIAEHLLDGAA